MKHKAKSESRKAKTLATILFPLFAFTLSALPSTLNPQPSTLLLIWDPAPGAVSYELWSTADLTQPWQFYTNAPTTNAIVPINLREPRQFFKPISVNADGLNSFGNYQ